MDNFFGHGSVKMEKYNLVNISYDKFVRLKIILHGLCLVFGIEVFWKARWQSLFYNFR